MKNILKFILLIFTLSFICCKKLSPEIIKNAPSPIDYIYYKGDAGIYKEKVYKFEYNGHHYIRFSERHSSIVHDPDCPCRNYSKID